MDPCIGKLRPIPKSGQLSKQDIQAELNCKKGLKIYSSQALLVDKYIQPASFDITPTIIAMSAKLGMLETVYKKNTQYTDSYYIYVHPKDTVLVVSNEFISLPSYIAGYVTSRVSNVVQGFGHISTTIDPNWNGAVLIALSNPSNHALKIEVGISTVREKQLECTGKPFRNPLATLTFHYLNTPCETKEQSHKSMRIDLLEKVKYDNPDNKASLWIRIQRKLMRKRRRFTDYFFEYVSTNESFILTEKGWNAFLQEFSSLKEPKKKAKNPGWLHRNEVVHAIDFAVKESRAHRFLRFLSEHIKDFLIPMLIIILLVAYIVGKIDFENAGMVLQAISIL